MDQRQGHYNVPFYKMELVLELYTVSDVAFQKAPQLSAEMAEKNSCQTS